MMEIIPVAMIVDSVYAENTPPLSLTHSSPPPTHSVQHHACLVGSLRSYPQTTTFKTRKALASASRMSFMASATISKNVGRGGHTAVASCSPTAHCLPSDTIDKTCPRFRRCPHALLPSYIPSSVPPLPSLSSCTADSVPHSLKLLWVALALAHRQHLTSSKRRRFHTFSFPPSAIPNQRRVCTASVSQANPRPIRSDREDEGHPSIAISLRVRLTYSPSTPRTSLISFMHCSDA
ncbi:hypothetical protein B0H14DRAFT_1343072 [Mycena olivaceomarginata]|nr:hypothetical protein B0H14DRAFT_1343072 [Mycena olivaceomarginata]